MQMDFNMYSSIACEVDYCYCFLMHLALSPDVEIKYIGGKDPELLFLGEDGQSVEERVSVINMSEDEINALLESKGILKHNATPEGEADNGADEPHQDL
uniref:Selenoprotein F/M domain-containing protein n=2 Tax=Amphimedon queenslandica TaxID=400682 RepID=A0A1X7TWV6_AMPQE